MYRSNESKVLYAAMAIGMLAQFNDRFDPEDVPRLRIMAREFMPEGGAALDLVEKAASAFELIRRDPERLAEWGRQLRDDALRVGRPDPVDAHRSDIHG
jgi:hypothetical protein